MNPSGREDDVRVLIAIIGMLAVAGLGGCASSSYTDYPIGIGSGPNALKRSPCACILLPNGAQTQTREG